MTSLPSCLSPSLYNIWHNHNHYTTRYTHCQSNATASHSKYKTTVTNQKNNHTQVIQQQSHVCASKQSNALGTTLFIIPVMLNQTKASRSRPRLQSQGNTLADIEVSLVWLVHFKLNIEMTMQANVLLIGRHASGENNSVPAWHTAGSLVCVPHTSLWRNTSVYCSTAYSIVFCCL